MTGRAVIAGSGATKQSPATDAAVIVVYTLAHSVAAVTAAAETGRPVVLVSSPEAGISGGPGWWRELIAAARAAAPAAEARAVLDCGGDTGAAQGAIRAGVEAIVFTGPRWVAERLADIAGRSGCTVLVQRPAATLDLAAEFFASPDRLHKSCADALRRA